jgi:hypothetical protein
MADKLSLSELRTFAGWMFDSLEGAGFEGLIPSSEHAHYVSVADDDLYSVDLESAELVVGSIADDIEFVKQDISHGKLSDLYTCIHFVELIRSAILRKNWAASVSKG